MSLLGQLDHLLTRPSFFQATWAPAAQTEVLGALHPDICDSARHLDEPWWNMHPLKLWWSKCCRRHLFRSVLLLQGDHHEGLHCSFETLLMTASMDQGPGAWNMEDPRLLRDMMWHDNKCPLQCTDTKKWFLWTWLQAQNITQLYCGTLMYIPCFLSIFLFSFPNTIWRFREAWPSARKLCHTKGSLCRCCVPEVEPASQWSQLNTKWTKTYPGFNADEVDVPCGTFIKDTSAQQATRASCSTSLLVCAAVLSAAHTVNALQPSGKWHLHIWAEYVKASWSNPTRLLRKLVWQPAGYTP